MTNDIETEEQPKEEAVFASSSNDFFGSAVDNEKLFSQMTDERKIIFICKLVDAVAPLPRCVHGYALRGYDFEPVYPGCGCTK